MGGRSVHRGRVGGAGMIQVTLNPVVLVPTRCQETVALADSGKLGSAIGIGMATCQLAVSHAGAHSWINVNLLTAAWGP